jgi:CRISP-associated protein Cas1
MGYEGLMRATYYEAWPLLDIRLNFGRRVRRPPNNPINCLLSWFNGLTYALCRNEIAQTYLDDCLSFLHSPHEARSSLALDLAEVFKPALADGAIFSIVSRDTNLDNWFRQDREVCRLSDVGRRKTLEIWTSRIDGRKHGNLCMRDVVRKEALAIERHLLGIPEYTPWKRII